MLSATAVQAKATIRLDLSLLLKLLLLRWRLSLLGENGISREEEIEYAEAHNIPLKINRETNYSKDKNVWHLSHEGLDLEDPANEPMYSKEGFLELGVAPEQAPDTPTYVTIHFEQGIPTAVDGKALVFLILLKTDLSV